MRAGLRLGLAMVAAGLSLAPAGVLAQSAPVVTTNTPTSDAIGPRELQNFSLNGTVTKPADAPTGPATQPRPRGQAAQTAADRSAATASRAGPSVAAASPRQTARSATPTTPPPSASAGESLALDLPPATVATPASVPQPGFAPDPLPPPSRLAPQAGFALWPWMLLAAFVAAGAAFLWWRRHSREAYAGGPEFDAFVAPEPAPSPRLAPAPPPAPKATAKPAGIVSTRLRPWIDLAFEPTGCVVGDDRVTIEFDVHLTNSGSAPARDVLVEASMFNAGARQEQDIAAFFAKPEGQGERIEAIAPLQNITIRTSLVAPRQNIQIFEVGGRQVFVPLVAFNAMYRLSSGPGQTSAAYMLGRETNGEKLGPLRADLGPKAFTKLGTRPLPIGVRT